MPEQWRVGSGYDLHSITSDRALILGGVQITGDFGLAGHTDGDVVLHAVVDALFGAAGLPDIGEHFPDSDPALRGASSRVLLARALDEVRGCGWIVNNVDLTILAERPTLAGHKETIRASLATLLGIPADRLGVKAKSNEGHDAVGQGTAIACQATLMLRTAQPEGAEESHGPARI